MGIKFDTFVDMAQFCDFEIFKFIAHFGALRASAENWKSSCMAHYHGCCAWTAASQAERRFCCLTSKRLCRHLVAYTQMSTLLPRVFELSLGSIPNPISVEA